MLAVGDQVDLTPNPAEARPRWSTVTCVQVCIDDHHPATCIVIGLDDTARGHRHSPLGCLSKGTHRRAATMVVARHPAQPAAVRSR